MPDKEGTLKDLKKYYKYLEKDRKHWENGVWKDVAENLFPYREDWSDTKMKGSRRAAKVFNSNPMLFLNIFADGLHGNMINPAIMWFLLRLPSQYRFLEEVPDVRNWLQETQETLYYFFSESNFYSVMRSFFADGGSIGTAYITCEEDKGNNKLVFSCLHPREAYIAENQFGRIDVMFRKFKLTARATKQKFGEAVLSPTIKQSLEYNPFTEHEIIHAVYPNNEFDKSKLGTDYKFFASKYFEADAPDNANFLREKGYDDFPFMIWRYFKGDKPPYGDSPATFALPEIMGLQVMGKTLLKAGHLSASPAYNIPMELQGEVDTNPDGLNYYGSDFNRRIYPVTTGINYPISQDRENKKEDILKRHYHVDYFLALEQAERQMTAREVIERMGEKATILASSIGDLSIVLDSIIDYIWNIKMQSFQLPPPPPILIEKFGGRRITIEYVGPLAQAQKRLFETRGITDSLEIVAPIIQMFPETADIINKDGIMKDLLKSFGFPQRDLNDPETIQQIRKGRAMQQEEQMKKIDMDMIAETIKKLAQANKNSPEIVKQLGEMMGGAGLIPQQQQGMMIPAEA